MSKQKILDAIQKKGWVVDTIDYERPRSGFKCIEGGWCIMFKTEYDDEDYDDLFDAIQICGSATVNNGIALSMTSKDMLKLISLFPDKPNNTML